MAVVIVSATSNVLDTAAHFYSGVTFSYGLMLLYAAWPSGPKWGYAFTTKNPCPRVSTAILQVCCRIVFFVCVHAFALLRHAACFDC